MRRPLSGVMVPTAAVGIVAAWLAEMRWGGSHESAMQGPDGGWCDKSPAPLPAERYVGLSDTCVEIARYARAVQDNASAQAYPNVRRKN